MGLEEKVKSEAGETPTSKRQTQDEEHRSKMTGDPEGKGVLETDGEMRLVLPSGDY